MKNLLKITSIVITSSLLLTIAPLTLAWPTCAVAFCTCGETQSNETCHPLDSSKASATCYDNNSGESTSCTSYCSSVECPPGTTDPAKGDAPSTGNSDSSTSSS